MQNGEVFRIELKDITLQVTGHILNSSEIFRIVFSDNRPALVVTESLTNGRPF